MASTPYLPNDPLARFQQLYDALNEERRWWREAAPLRFAAIAALTCPGTPTQVATTIRKLSLNLRDKAGWLGRLDSRLRFVVAAMLRSNGDSAGAFLQEVKRVRAMFKRAGLRRAAVYETFAILILRIHAERSPITESTVRRFKAMYEGMKRYHWWLTGPDDFPASAILTGQKDSPTHVAQDVEEIYRSLRAAGFSAGDPLQTAANVLYLAKLDPRKAASRYAKLAASFRRKRVAIWQSDYDELAILAFLNHPADRVVEHVLQNRAAMKSLRPQPNRSLTFNLASSITFLELIPSGRGKKMITDAKALLDMQSIITAQRAASSGAAASAAAAG